MTLGTQIFTWICGQYVGSDGSGNRYYRTRRMRRYGREKRWVLFKGTPEASKIPPEWHAWLHHMVQQPLAEQAAKAAPWQKPHLPNLSGTPLAYLPRGHELKQGQRARATGDYEPWTPD